MSDMHTPRSSQVSRLEWVERVSRLLDSQFRVPGTNFRFGLDPIMGLIPGLGDFSSFAISGVLLLTMARHGVSRKLLFLMAGNLMIDAIIGSIPILGSIFDFTFKANKRNMRLLQQHYEEGKHHGSGTGIIVAILIALLALAGLAMYLSWKLVVWVLSLF
jgi:hypothetical protein